MTGALQQMRPGRGPHRLGIAMPVVCSIGWSRAVLAYKRGECGIIAGVAESWSFELGACEPGSASRSEGKIRVESLALKGNGET